jgi:hypothetical protein
MSFDRTTRNALARMVGQVREFLKVDVMDQLRRLGFQADGCVLDLDQIAGLTELERMAGRELRDLLEHFVALESGSEAVRRKSAYDRLAREIGFTTLNRLVALRMAEERGLIVQAVGRGLASVGFQIYERVAWDALGNRAETYRAYLECLYDELALDLPMLFDRTTPESHIFPSERCLENVLILLNDAGLAHLWKEDEAIGWVYQYYNDPAERKKMREVPIPRNSRELAVRNQFFTPRYVVEFLTDNTLGRLWYEIQQGNTKLSDQCRYLVRRPVEIFLHDGEEAPQAAEAEEDLSPEELLNQPVFIPFRAKKDPRDLKILDPACGSGHFLLYAFDLLETIYDEAWADSDSPISAVTGTRLRNDYTDLRALRQAVPGLILRHNLYGIDIDPRACQIAALALWLRAQRNYQQIGLQATERPSITKSNIVCAEPMPGEREMLEEYLKEHVDPRLQHLVRTIWGKMQLAGEAGSLLRIEEEIETALSEAREQAFVDTPSVQLPLLQQVQPVQMRMIIPTGDERTFWEQAEEKLLIALRDYSSMTANAHPTQRRLFVEDMTQGFAFIDLCRKKFDVVLMNPPFGEFTASSKEFAIEFYDTSKSDIGLSMVSRGLALAGDSGLVGAITSRLFIVNDNLRKWRQESLLSKHSLFALLDLGYGVLDGAMVEVAAYIISQRSVAEDTTASFIQVLDERDKEGATNSYFLSTPFPRTFHFVCLLNELKKFPSYLICYWLPKNLSRLLENSEGLTTLGGNAHFGASTSDDFQFARLRWEVPAEAIENFLWVPFAKGGEYNPLFEDISLLLEWAEDGRRLKTFVDRKSFETQGGGGWTRWINGVEFYFLEGLTFPERTTSDLCPQILPRGSLFSAIGSAIHFKHIEAALSYLGVAFTRPFKILADAVVGSGDSSVSGSAARHYRPGIVNNLPIPCNLFDTSGLENVKECISLIRSTHRTEEISWEFTGSCFHIGGSGLTSWASRLENERLCKCVEVIQLNMQFEEMVKSYLGLSAEDIETINVGFGPHPASYSSELNDELKEQICEIWLKEEKEIVERAVAIQGARRQLTKKSYIADRRLELTAHALKVHPLAISKTLAKDSFGLPDSIYNRVKDLISYCIGCAFGRWDIRLALSPENEPKPPQVFAPIPTCAAGMLVSSNGMPASANFIVSEQWLCSRPDAYSLPSEGLVAPYSITDQEYPIRISWHGILVDDPGPDGVHSHQDDIIRHIYDVLANLIDQDSDEVEEEICKILGVRNLREYFRRPSAFFADHLARYSRSHRQAPIYWPLATASGSYTLWIYYNRLTSDTLFTTINRYVEPKITEIQRKIGELERRLTELTGREAARLRGEIEDAYTLLEELQDLRAELQRVVALPYRPDLNDGVIINAAPLHRLFRFPKWAKDTKACWEKLQRGEYDWAHLAYTLWPDRVREKCRTDRSLAIAHDLEHLYVEQPTIARRKRSPRAVSDKEDEE